MVVEDDLGEVLHQAVSHLEAVEVVLVTSLVFKGTE